MTRKRIPRWRCQLMPDEVVSPGIIFGPKARWDDHLFWNGISHTEGRFEKRLKSLEPLTWGQERYFCTEEQLAIRKLKWIAVTGGIRKKYSRWHIQSLLSVIESFDRYRESIELEDQEV